LTVSLVDPISVQIALGFFIMRSPQSAVARWFAVPKPPLGSFFGRPLALRALPYQSQIHHVAHALDPVVFGYRVIGTNACFETAGTTAIS